MAKCSICDNESDALERFTGVFDNQDFLACPSCIDLWGSMTIRAAIEALRCLVESQAHTARGESVLALRAALKAGKYAANGSSLFVRILAKGFRIEAAVVLEPEESDDKR